MIWFWGRPKVGIAGTAAGVLASVVGGAVGSVADRGTASGSLARVVGAASGTVGAGGAGAGTLARVTGSASGSVATGGTAAGSLSRVTGSATGSVTGGMAVGTLKPVTGAAVGSVSVTGTATGTLSPITGAGAGVVGNGTGVGALKSIAGAASGLVSVTGTAAGTLSRIVGSASATPQPLIREAVANAVATCPDVAAVVGGRVYPQTDPEGVDPPVVLVNLESITRIHSLDGPTGTSWAEFTFLLVGRSLADNQALALAIYNLFDGFTGVLSTPGGDRVVILDSVSEDESDDWSPPQDGTSRGKFVTPHGYRFLFRELHSKAAPGPDPATPVAPGVASGFGDLRYLL